MKVYAIIPARSGSKGFKNKNIQTIDGRPLISYSISFAHKLGVDKVLCSTDSEEYKAIAIAEGAEVPFLRGVEASSDTAMEQDILVDLNINFERYNIEKPDIIVWLRPTFVFRDLDLVQKGIDYLKRSPQLSAVRTVCESEGRLYRIDEGFLRPDFDDQQKSMIRRQDIGKRYKVFSTDILRFTAGNLHDDFLGRNVLALETNKICGLDIDDEIDFKIVKCLVESRLDFLQQYIH
ncbi:MAG TPA: acylneuraminate cytidylyltransferase family protein [Edaphocola sp.]|nr:acylneuraminate cytidylyltransferase family protein [Edaphocola sp.]